MYTLAVSRGRARTVDRTNIYLAVAELRSFFCRIYLVLAVYMVLFLSVLYFDFWMVFLVFTARLNPVAYLSFSRFVVGRLESPVGRLKETREKF